MTVSRFMTFRRAWTVSKSQLDPGNLTTPNFMAGTFIGLEEVPLELLDDGVGQDATGDLGDEALGLFLRRAREVDLEDLALPDVLDGAVTHRVQGVLDGLSLGVETLS